MRWTCSQKVFAGFVDWIEQNGTLPATFFFTFLLANSYSSFKTQIYMGRIGCSLF